MAFLKFLALLALVAVAAAQPTFLPIPTGGGGCGDGLGGANDQVSTIQGQGESELEGGVHKGVGLETGFQKNVGFGDSAVFGAGINAGLGAGIGAAGTAKKAFDGTAGAGISAGLGVAGGISHYGH